MIDCEDLDSITPKERMILIKRLNYIDTSISQDILNNYLLSEKINYCKLK